MTTDLQTIFPVISLNRVVLREISPQDVPAAFSIFSDSKVVKYWGTVPFKEESDVAGMLEDMKNSFYQKDGIRWAIALKDSDKFIGTVGFHNWSKSQARCEIGYELSQDQWGKGIASEVLPAVLSHGFNQFGLNRIGAVIRKENIGSIKAVEKFGFKAEGVLRDYQCIDGIFYDLIMYSLLKKEFIGERI